MSDHVPNSMDCDCLSECEHPSHLLAHGDPCRTCGAGEPIADYHRRWHEPCADFAAFGPPTPELTPRELRDDLASRATELARKYYARNDEVCTWFEDERDSVGPAEVAP